MFKAVVFDLDGTLYDFKWLPLRLICTLPTDITKIRADRQVRKELKGKDFGTSDAYKSEYAHLIAKRTGFTPKDALNWYYNRYMNAMEFVLKRHYSQRPKLEEVFQWLYQHKKKIAIFSDYPLVQQRIKALDFSDKTINIISGIYSAEDFGCQKPAKRPFLEIAAQLGVKPQECLVVGDRDDTDGDGARTTGMSFIQIKTHKTKSFETNHPLWTWEKFAQWVLEGMEPLKKQF